MTDEAAAAWAAGFIDGEGCVYDRRGRSIYGRFWNKVLTVTNTDPALISFYRRCLDQLEIRYVVGKYPRPRPHRDVMRVDIIRGDSLRRALDVIPIQAPKKIERLRRIVAELPVRRCSGCQQPYDKKTSGCLPCYQRHKVRGYRKLPGAKAEAARRARARRAQIRRGAGQ